ncbi:DUF2326 domain-containing protein [Paenibacillus sp. HWE-109]|uniref:DUF2326 domain-containing protein n=1 Tax=Paenibacillus sp. HWE-109 TaxID=1306526 RepID=UPI001EE016E8|nr:DUF2326 domain-containing protein [Paenibacillus sp. HWE-109]UKS29947.1 DUF2326 domain-containing protein [Paenibacillus sp. HWE-109]
MKIMKIYSNKKSFKVSRFSEGLNIILGKVTKSYDRDKDTHNLGKTTLITIIDFLLLKSINKEHIFVKHKKKFNDYVFFLEIKLNDGNYITVKRSVGNPSKISIEKHQEKDQDFVDLLNWDYKDLPLKSKFPDKNPKIILDKLLDFNVLQSYDYRQTVNYFLRTQEDYNKVFHLSKFAGKDIDWKPFLFNLLGFNDECVINKYKLHDEANEQEKMINRLENEFSINTEAVDKINGLIKIKEEERNELSLHVDNFDFYQKESDINKSLIEDLESIISKYNSEKYSLNFEIDKIKESLRIKSSFDLEEVEQIFSESKIYFSEQLKRDYQSLIKFNERVTAERNKHLFDILVSKEIQLVDVNVELENLNNKRSELLSFLKEKDTFQKFKNYQSQLIGVEKEIERFKFQLQNIDLIKNANDKLKDLRDDILEANDEIIKEVSKENNLYTNIRLTFNSLMKQIINQPGILSIGINTVGNIDFKAEIANLNNEETTSKDKGHTYKKILCVCFDIALLINYNKHSFYRFVYHDGSLESLDRRKKLQYLEVINEVCKKYDIQYILTVIEDDIPLDDMGNAFQFTDTNIALVLDDSDDNKGRLFEDTF